MKQSTALEVLQTGANVFLTGEPGSGKTHTINQYIAWLRDHGIEPAVTASTGIAATHIGGMTIHSWSGIGIKRELTEYDLDEIMSRERLILRARGTKVLIIDEISMIEATTLTMVERAIRALKHTSSPWGGMQVIFVGDFFQLPPVSRERAGIFAFSSPAWEAANPLVCYLSEQHRQDDQSFIDLLTAIRRGTVDESHHELLEGRQTSLDTIPEDAARLYSHNRDVDTENTGRLDVIEGTSMRYEMSSKGGASLVEQLKRGCLSPEILFLKKGARVMFTKNSIIGAYANGTLGEIVDFGINGPIVKIAKGKRVEAEPQEWSITEGGKVLARITQIPLRLAWAITVHKSQGMTLDAAAVDLSSAFEYGQGYVALSRVRDLSGLHVIGYNTRALQVHPDILTRDRDFKLSSAAARKRFEAMPPKELHEYSEAFVKAAGGDPKGGLKKEPEQMKEKIDTFAATLALGKQGYSLEKIVELRGLKTETIISHLEKLKKNGDFSLNELRQLIPRATAPDMLAIQKAFKKSDSRSLSPMHSSFKGKHSFETIRLARLLMED